jgi:hypothetical protein
LRVVGREMSMINLKTGRIKVVGSARTYVTSEPRREWLTISKGFVRRFPTLEAVELEPKGRFGVRGFLRSVDR